jgi:hypothetical protein
MSEKITISKDAVEVASKLAQSIAVNISDERAAKFGYDMMKGIISGNYTKRLNAWIEWYNNYMEGNRDSVDEERDGVWVPAIPYTIE